MVDLKLPVGRAYSFVFPAETQGPVVCGAKEGKEVSKIVFGDDILQEKSTLEGDWLPELDLKGFQLGVRLGWPMAQP